ncbi:hypothetical protein DB347_00130 [Opitutaceae bacterium EW11]|nr:hypothetical protein DB347_00130 [Opitutaceae bacterium EW11]
MEELGEKLDPADFRYEQDAVSVWYGPKAQLDPEQRKLYQKLGFAPQGGDRLSWPDIRSHRPGFFPWYPEESELRVLVDVIPGILCLAEIYRSHPDCYDRRDGLELPAVPAAGAPVKLDSLQWRTWLTPPPPEIGPAVQVDLASPAFRRAAALPRQDETLEVDWFYMPEAVMEEGRPFYGRCLAVFREHGGYCFGMDLLKPGDDAAIRAATMILEAVERLGARPARITATKPELAERLRPLAASLGAESKTVHRLLSVGEFRAGLEARMAEGMP